MNRFVKARALARFAGGVIMLGALTPVAAQIASNATPELVSLDEQGVIRWTADRREVALFGANYSLPSACDYRAAGYVNADRKKLVEKDMTHFARMGWDGMRLCLWGDWENSDKQGNLIVNDHLDVMDYAIYQAKLRGIYVLFTPIATYSSLWPDGKDSDEVKGFSKFYRKDELGTNPDAIAAQCNYLRQILDHVNPYTHVALKDEPAILFVELINEPSHHSGDLAGSIAYIDALVDAVRSTGCRKILFYNVSQDFRITPAIKASKAQGVSFAWYPTGLNLGHTLTENYLRAVDDYPPMLRPDLLNVPKLVYEFDSADMNSGYMYPAMVRAFRGVGAQFISMFSYDMLDTAPYNLGWQTHFLNLVYSPQKAVSAIIAAEATRMLPRYSHYGDYPDNRRFGPFRVSYEEDLSEMVTDEKFLYANDTHTNPPTAAALRQIVGLGSSPLVEYEGRGCYFLDKIESGAWRLEVYPDAIIVQDPFAQRLNYRTVSSRQVSRMWPMMVRLPDLGGAFAIAGLNSGNTYTATARDARFEIKPGVYLLSKNGRLDRSKLPEHVGRIGLTEFVCPLPPDLPVQLVPAMHAEYPADQPVVIATDVIDAQPPGSVTLHLRAPGDAGFRAFPMLVKHGYRYEATIPVGAFSGATFEYYFAVETNGAVARFPAEGDKLWTARLVPPAAPLQLFGAEQDMNRLVYTRIGDAMRRGIFTSMPATTNDPAALRLFFPLSYDRTLDDYTASLSVKNRIADRGARVAEARALRVKARGAGDGQRIYLTLVETDGTSWSQRLTLSSEWQEIVAPTEQFKIACGVKLPLGFPERWNYWLTPAKGRGQAGDRPCLGAVEHLQVSFRPVAGVQKSETDAWADIASITLLFESSQVSGEQCQTAVASKTNSLGP
jgi:hypothetical protein